LSLVPNEPDLERRTAKQVSLTVYFFSLLLMYTSSTLLHGFFLLESVENIFKVLDHISIYVLIAGTYTPVIGMNMMHTNVGVGLLTVEWTMCGTGCFSYVIINQLGILGKHTYLDIMEISFYVIMGWAVVLYFPTFVSCVTPYSRYMIAAGGLVYTAGIAFFVAGKHTPIHHVVWHFFVLVATILHFFAIKDIVNNPVPSTCR